MTSRKSEFYEGIQHFNPVPNIQKDGIHSGYIYNDFDQYDPFKLDTSVDPYITGYSYMFMTTPALNVVDDGSNAGDIVSGNLSVDPFLKELSVNENHILEALTTLIPSHSKFIRVLTNRLKSFTPNATSSRTITVGETLGGFKQMQPGSNIESRSADQLNVSYVEYQDLGIIKLHKAWSDYIERVRRGDLLPHPRYLENDIIDYMSSIYYFTLKPDGQTISYFTKYTGVAPVSIPYDTLSYSRGDIAAGIDISIPYVYSYKEDLNPKIIEDFNKIMTGRDEVSIKVRNKDSAIESQAKKEYLLEFKDYGEYNRNFVYKEDDSY